MPALLNQRLRLESRHDSREAESAPDVPLLRKQLESWEQLADTFDEVTEEVRIGIVGKYTDLHDTYLSVVKALLHASLSEHLRLSVEWIDSSALEGSASEDPEVLAQAGEAWSRLQSCHGILVPGGFGERGLEGKVLSARFARTTGTPYLGICLGMQAAVIDFARDVMGVEDANSEEFASHLDRESQVVVFMPEGSTTHMGGTMRLGSRLTDLRDGSLVRRLYGSASVEERHRHRYEVNPDLAQRMESAGLRFVGTNADRTGVRMEVCELDPDTHPFFVGSQYHPEFKSRPGEPSPLFIGFIQAARGVAASR
jgi:CTP synthase